MSSSRALSLMHALRPLGPPLALLVSFTLMGWAARFAGARQPDGLPGGWDRILPWVAALLLAGAGVFLLYRVGRQWRALMEGSAALFGPLADIAQVGDYVVVEGHPALAGWVDSMTWRKTRLRRRDGNLALCANRLVTRVGLVNYSRPESYARFEIGVRVSSAIQADRCLRVLDNALRSLSEGRLALPLLHRRSEVLIGAVGQYVIDYRIRVWLNPSEHDEAVTLHRLRQRILQHLRFAGIPLRRDQNALSTERTDEESPAMELLASIDLFTGLEEGQLRPIVSQLGRRRFPAGTLVLQEGEISTEMYFIAEGLVRVTVRGGGQDMPLGLLSAGDYFGEMALLTDQPRSANVRCETPVVVHVLSRDSMRAAVREHPEILPRMSDNLAMRRVQRDTTVLRAHRAAASPDEGQGNAPGGWLARMEELYAPAGAPPGPPPPPA